MTTDPPQSIDPATTALLVLDYQNGVLERVPDAARLLAGATRAIGWLRGQGGHIGFVRVGFADGEAPTPAMGRRLGAEAMRAAFAAGAPATQLHADLDPQPHDIVVRKTRVGPFAGTGLDERLRTAGVDTLLLAGISTSGAVLSAVRDAHDRDYRLIVVSDLCADPEPDVHAFLLERILSRQAELVTSAELSGLVA
jgi:nicotinamidase-related amidase